jgi:hypothetical protein
MATNEFEEGREAQYREMMKQLAALQAKYKGVRGVLLEKVRAEFLALNPSGSASAPAVSAPAPEKKIVAAPLPEKKVVAAPPPPAEKVAAKPAAPAKAAALGKILPSCRVCGRGMTPSADGNLVCAKGHTRSAA